ncbi:MAG TPA: MBL fold metallo-hydrolase [Propionibacterium sp.]|jgi:glyoxylase-like metal-dependent hydrolase (beta-lactamase superfamily II)|nr:MBL fold metallo-hydrolase [Propionibacterium sp.]
MSEVRIDHGVSRGTFSLDGETFEVENNIWVIGDDKECFVLDAPHNVEDIMALVGDRDVAAILCTHAHDDHVRAAVDLGIRTNAPILLNPRDLRLWKQTHPNVNPDNEINHNDVFYIGGTGLRVLHTPGHSEGGVCLYVPNLGVVFSGDTLFKDGPGATGRSFSSKEVILDSIHKYLFTLPEDTIVHPGHGESTTIGAEKAKTDIYAQD